METLINIVFVIAAIIAIYMLCVWLIVYAASRVYSYKIQSFQKKCPKCQGDWHERIHRKWWMHLIPGTKYYRCNKCRSKFMIIFWKNILEIS